MLRLLRVFAPLALVLAAGSAPASQLPWSGTFSLEFGTVPPIVAQGGGVATLNGSSTVGHLQTLRLAGGIAKATTIPLTDPENPGLVSLRATASLGTGTFSGISGGPPLPPAGNVLPVRGLLRICLALPGCSANLPVPLPIDGLKGVGIGSRITVNTFSAGAGVKISLDASPWTLGVAFVTGIPTPSGGFSTVTARGFVHGPVSGTSSTADPAGSGAIRLVTPVRVTTNLFPPNDVLALMGTLTVHFVPEPGLLLLMGSGIAGLAVIGRHRSRR